MSHDLGHHGVLEVLERDSDIRVVFLAQEQVPKTQRASLGLERLNDGGVVLPSLRGVGVHLGMESGFCWDTVLLDKLDEFDESVLGERRELVLDKSPSGSGDESSDGMRFRCGRHAVGWCCWVEDVLGRVAGKKQRGPCPARRNPVCAPARPVPDPSEACLALPHLCASGPYEAGSNRACEKLPAELRCRYTRTTRCLLGSPVARRLQKWSELRSSACWRCSPATLPSDTHLVVFRNHHNPSTWPTRYRLDSRVPTSTSRQANCSSGREKTRLQISEMMMYWDHTC